MSIDVRRLLPVLALAGALLPAHGCVSTGSGPTTSRQTDRQHAAQIHTQLGQAYFAQGDLKAAYDKLKTALKFDSNYAPAHTVLGALYERLGKPAEAEREYRRAVEIHPEDGAANNNLGAFLCQQGSYDDGIAHFQKALADPFYATPATAWTNAGICRSRQGQLGEAENDFRSALAIDAKYPDALYQMARVLHQAGDDFRASAYVQRYLGADAPPSAAVYKLGYDVESALGHSDRANEYAHQLAKQFPDSAAAGSVTPTTTP